MEASATREERKKYLIMLLTDRWRKYETVVEEGSSTKFLPEEGLVEKSVRSTGLNSIYFFHKNAFLEIMIKLF